MKISLAGKVLVLNYAIAVLVIIALRILNVTESLLNDLYGVLFLGFIPVFGGINGLILSRSWGYLKSAIGRSVIFFSLGLILWGIGTYIFSGYFNFIEHISTPYPSIADIGYILALPFWLAGMFELSRASGAKYGMRSVNGKAILFVIPLIVIAISYYLLVSVARGGIGGISPDADPEISVFKELCLVSYCIPKIFFDLAYPIGDVIILAMTSLVYALSFKYFGGIYKKAIQIVLIGFVFMYIADFSFSYITNFGDFYPANWVDFLFTTAVFALSIGVSLLDPKRIKEIDK